jgi:hypothetical protein
VSGNLLDFAPVADRNGQITYHALQACRCRDGALAVEPNENGTHNTPEPRNSPRIDPRDRKTYIAVAVAIVIVTILQVFILF